MIPLESCGSGIQSDFADCHTQMYGGYSTLLLAGQETGPWEGDAYFIAKGSTLSAKRAELHCAVIGKRPKVVSERFSAFLTDCSSIFFFSFFFIIL